ncbi:MULTISPECIES: hypothetical protein [unclassified Micromonospora]|uniref:hypothetical protein n=1 Tax=unclassified Micromonospora TaxID=2617518 RepID=UPI003A87C687
MWEGDLRVRCFLYVPDFTTPLLRSAEGGGPDLFPVWWPLTIPGPPADPTPTRHSADRPGGRRRTRHQPEHRAQGVPRTGTRRCGASRPGVGTFVLASLSARRAASNPAIRTQLAAWVATARAAGLDDDLRAVLAAELAENASPRTTDDQPGRTGC